MDDYGSSGHDHAHYGAHSHPYPLGMAIVSRRCMHARSAPATQARTRAAAHRQLHISPLHTRARAPAHPPLAQVLAGFLFMVLLEHITHTLLSRVDDDECADNGYSHSSLIGFGTACHQHQHHRRLAGGVPIVAVSGKPPQQEEYSPEAEAVDGGKAARDEDAAIEVAPPLGDYKAAAAPGKEPAAAGSAASGPDAVGVLTPLRLAILAYVFELGCVFHRCDVVRRRGGPVAQPCGCGPQQIWCMGWAAPTIPHHQSAHARVRTHTHRACCLGWECAPGGYGGTGQGRGPTTYASAALAARRPSPTHPTTTHAQHMITPNYRLSPRAQLHHRPHAGRHADPVRR